MNVQMSSELLCVGFCSERRFILWKTEFPEYWDLWSNLYQIPVDYLLIPPLFYKDPKIGFFIRKRTMNVVEVI